MNDPALCASLLRFAMDQLEKQRLNLARVLKPVSAMGHLPLHPCCGKLACSSKELEMKMKVVNTKAGNAPRRECTNVDHKLPGVARVVMTKRGGVLCWVKAAPFLSFHFAPALG